MDKLIITVTCDPTMSFPETPNAKPIEDVKFYAEEYNRSVDAGASTCHVHGVHWLEEEMQPDGRKLSKVDFNGWQELKDRIKDHCNPIMQYGIASARMNDKKKLMEQGPELMSYAFSAHDEYFQPNPDKPAKTIQALHPLTELREFLTACREHGVKPEVESFQFGALFNMMKLREEGYFDPTTRIYTTFFISWPGGAWTPPTPKALQAYVDHLPENVVWNVSAMDYNPALDWRMLATSIILGGHVRVGWEDNPYLEQGVYADTNARLVEKIVRISRDLGREIASPEEAREIIFRKIK